MFDASRLTWPSIPLIKHQPDEAFAIIADAGFKNVDVLEKMPHFSIFPDECDPKALKAAADKHGLRITAINAYVGGGVHGRAGAWVHHPGFQFPNKERYTEVGFASDNPKDQAREVKDAVYVIDQAAFFGSRLVRFVPGDEDPAKIPHMLPCLKEIARYAEQKNVYLACENHETGILGQPQTLVDMFEKVGSDHMGVIYEPLNLMDQAGVDYRKAFEVMRDHIMHVHIKDGRLDLATRTYLPTLMGEGDFDWLWLMDRLDATGYKHEIGLEYEVVEVPPEEGIKQFYNGFLKMVEGR
jgi:sugar phosphate isomerase/epimerase